MVFAPDIKDPLTSPESPELNIGDCPPSYDAVAAQDSVATGSGNNVEASSSSASHPAQTRQPPKDTLYLFSGPPGLNENVLGRNETSEEILESIQTYERNGVLFSSDPRLNNGKSS